MFSLTVFGCALFRAALQHEKEIHHLERKNKKMKSALCQFCRRLYWESKGGVRFRRGPCAAVAGFATRMYFKGQRWPHTYTCASPLFPHAAASFAFPSDTAPLHSAPELLSLALFFGFSFNVPNQAALTSAWQENWSREVNHAVTLFSIHDGLYGRWWICTSNSPSRCLSFLFGLNGLSVGRMLSLVCMSLTQHSQYWYVRCIF